MKEENCKVIENINVNEKYFLMKIEAGYIAQNSQPGNFVMVAASSTYDPLLKRPFGIFNVESPFIWLYYEVVGKGSELMSNLKGNDNLTVLGPLGNSFPKFADKNILFVAGGRGIAPLYYTIAGYPAHNNLFLIYGAKSAGDLNLLDKIDSLPLKGKFLYTDDGSAGEKGFVTARIREIIKEQKIDITISCGPDAMFKSLSRELAGLPLENYVSLEAIMGCGFGICYSCAVKLKEGGYKKVCTDGPVFKMEDIEW
jgi:dihydroorotate dehydrogenase electron transfer subunit